MKRPSPSPTSFDLTMTLAGVMLLTSSGTLGYAALMSGGLDPVREWSVLLLVAIGWATFAGAARARRKRRVVAAIMGAGAALGAITCPLVAAQFYAVGKLSQEQINQFGGMTGGLLVLVACASCGIALFGPAESQEQTG